MSYLPRNMDSVCVHVAQASLTEPSQDFLLPNICNGIDTPKEASMFLSPITVL